MGESSSSEQPAKKDTQPITAEEFIRRIFKGLDENIVIKKDGDTYTIEFIKLPDTPPPPEG